VEGDRRKVEKAFAGQLVPLSTCRLPQKRSAGTKCLQRMGLGKKGINLIFQFATEERKGVEKIIKYD
jgi:hypothetical protein